MQAQRGCETSYKTIADTEHYPAARNLRKYLQHCQHMPRSIRIVYRHARQHPLIQNLPAFIYAERPANLRTVKEVCSAQRADTSFVKQAQSVRQLSCSRTVPSLVLQSFIFGHQ